MEVVAEEGLLFESVLSLLTGVRMYLENLGEGKGDSEPTEELLFETIEDPESWRLLLFL